MIYDLLSIWIVLACAVTVVATIVYSREAGSTPWTWLKHANATVSFYFAVLYGFLLLFGAPEQQTTFGS